VKNFLDVLGDVTDFIIGKEIDDEPEKEKVFGFNPKPIKKKRKYKRRKSWMNFIIFIVVSMVVIWAILEYFGVGDWYGIR